MAVTEMSQFGAVFVFTIWTLRFYSNVSKF